MKVKELIKQLLAEDLDSEVYIRYTNKSGELLFLDVDSLTHNKKSYLGNESYRGNVSLQAFD